MYVYCTKLNIRTYDRTLIMKLIQIKFRCLIIFLIVLLFYSTPVCLVKFINNHCVYIQYISLGIMYNTCAGLDSNQLLYVRILYDHIYSS